MSFCTKVFKTMDAMKKHEEDCYMCQINNERSRVIQKNYVLSNENISLRKKIKDMKQSRLKRLNILTRDINLEKSDLIRVNKYLLDENEELKKKVEKLERQIKFSLSQAIKRRVIALLGKRLGVDEYDY